jgi:hypothetical protein
MHKELKQRDKKINQCYQLLAIQNECLETYLKKHEQQSADLETETENEIVQKPDKKRWQKAKDTIGSAIIVSSTLFYSYYAVTLALTVAFAGFAFVSAMTGPIGIGVALGIALVAGISIAYMKYRQDSKNQILKNNRKEMECQFNIKYDKYQALRFSAHNKKNDNTTELSPSRHMFKAVPTKSLAPDENSKMAAFPVGKRPSHDAKNGYQNMEKMEKHRLFTKEKMMIFSGPSRHPEEGQGFRYSTLRRDSI